jgi:Neuraminidase (sialidase)
MSRSYYDDNFGHWHDMDDADNVEFYHETQRKSVWKRCQRCGNRVKIKPEYGICNSCADAIERGGDY